MNGGRRWNGLVYQEGRIRRRGRPRLNLGRFPFGELRKPVWHERKRVCHMAGFLTGLTHKESKKVSKQG
jgi:hypothetical protein